MAFAGRPMPESRDPISAPKTGQSRSDEPGSARRPIPRTRFQRLLHRLGLWPHLHNPLSFRSSLLAAFLGFWLVPTLVLGVWLDRAFPRGVSESAIENGRNRVWVLIAVLILLAVALALASWLSARWVGLLDALPRRLRNLDSDEIPEERLPENRFSPSELREIEASILFLGRRIRKTVAEVSAAHQQLSQTSSDVVRVRQSVERQVLERTQELTDRLRLAEKSERSKGLFLAQLSHEIRTPLHGILGMLHLLEQSSLGPEQRDWMETLRSSAAALLNVLDDSLDYSKIEAGKMRLVSEAFDLRQVIERVGKLFAPRSAEKKLTLDVRIDPHLPERMKGDADRIAQVVSNLVSNAIKFTQSGRVGLSVHLTSRDLTLVGVRIEVEDSGPGMDSDTQARLFQAYFQGEGGAQRRSSGGTGLGLAISRQLVQLMGGQILVRSRPGEGTLVSVDLVLPWVETASSVAVGAMTQPPKPFRALKLLVVDDDPTSQKFIRILLGRAGHEVKTFDTAEAMLSDWILGSRFDAVLIDLRLPQMSGLELASRLRELEVSAVTAAGGARSTTVVPGTRTHLIALTASALEEDRRQALQAGFDHFLAKPIRVAELERALERVPSVV